MGSWTFGQKVGAGFALMVALAILIGGIAVYALRSVVEAKDRVIAVNAQNLIDATKLDVADEWQVATSRGFLLSREERFLDRLRTARADFTAAMGRLRPRLQSEEGARLLDQVERTAAEHVGAVDAVIAARKTETPLEAVARRFDAEVLPKRDALNQQLAAFVAREERVMEDARRAASDSASLASSLVLGVVLAAVVVAAGIALLLTRTLARQIGSAVQHIRSSSAELQAAASQQATGSKEQAAATNEITTTIKELLSTSRQIAESARGVAGIAGETATAARGGDETVQKAQEAIAGIKRQVDVIVTHMLDLGKRSQHIGGILEIVNELAEQTNILAINATIEAAGAGETGKRFAAVADEIRKLADRVGGSTKEIRTATDEIRAAVNATVMATEAGTKTVDTGARQFGEVASSFRRIAGQVGTTTEAAREIELSTKQQATAVEQVNVAIANVAQAARETEASSAQTVQTASELAALSRELGRLVQPNGAGG